METAWSNTRRVLAGAQSPAVLWSAGKDSMLLLHMVRELRPDTPVIWFRTGQPEHFARRIIREWGLTALSWAPADVYLLGKDTERSLVTEFDFGGARLPVISDLGVGDRCVLRAFPDRTPQLFLPFDTILSGYKDSDTHWIKGTAELFREGTTVGRAKLFAPIRHMSDDQVRAALAEMNIPYESVPDELPICTRCTEPGEGEVFCPELQRYIPRHQWEQDVSLTAFRKRFQLEDTNGQGI